MINPAVYVIDLALGYRVSYCAALHKQVMLVWHLYFHHLFVYMSKTAEVFKIKCVFSFILGFTQIRE